MGREGGIFSGASCWLLPTVGLRDSGGQVQHSEASLGPACRTHLVMQQAGGVPGTPWGRRRSVCRVATGVRAQVVGQVEAVLRSPCHSADTLWGLSAVCRAKWRAADPSGSESSCHTHCSETGRGGSMAEPGPGPGRSGARQRRIIHGGAVQGQWRVGAL